MKSKNVKDLLIGDIVAENIYRSHEAKEMASEIPVISKGVKLTESTINKLHEIFGSDFTVFVKDANHEAVHTGTEKKQALKSPSNENNNVNLREKALKLYKDAFYNNDVYKNTKNKLLSSFKKIDGVMQDFKTTKKLDDQTLTHVGRKLADLVGADKNKKLFDPALLYIVEMEKWDEVTFNHSFDVGVLALAFATTFTNNAEELASLFITGLVHDIGKFLYSKFELNAMDYIIKKQGKLSDEEFEQIKKHVDVEDFLENSFDDFDKRYKEHIIYGAAEHHEKFQGLGYSKNKKGMEISFAGRMIALCDVYDAMLRERRYKNAMKPNLVMDFIKTLTEKGQFDPHLFKKFIKAFGKYPVGSVLKTSYGMAVVVEQTNDYLKPIIFSPEHGELNTAKINDIEIEDEKYFAE